MWGGGGGSSHKHCRATGYVTPPRSQTVPCSETELSFAIEFKLKHIPCYCSVMLTCFPSLKNEGFAAMLLALKEIFDAAKSSARKRLSF